MGRPSNTAYALMDYVYEDELTNCWVWIGAVAQNGYSKVTVNYRTTSAHRFIYEQLVGIIPEGLQIDHKCRNKLCVNPEHLEAVTCKVNMERRSVLITECKYGHPLSGDNLYICPQGKRGCKTCRREAVRRSARN